MFSTNAAFQKECINSAQELIEKYKQKYQDLFDAGMQKQLFVSAHFPSLAALDAHFEALVSKTSVSPQKEIIKICHYLQQQLFCLQLFFGLDDVIKQVNRKVLALKEAAAQFELKLKEAKKRIEIEIANVNAVSAFIINDLRDKGYSAEHAQHVKLNQSPVGATANIVRVLLELPSIDYLNSQINLLIEAYTKENDEALQIVLANLMFAKTKMKGFSALLKQQLADCAEQSERFLFALNVTLVNPFEQKQLKDYDDELILISFALQILSNNDVLINSARQLHKFEKEKEGKLGLIARKLGEDIFQLTKDFGAKTQLFATLVIPYFTNINSIIKCKEDIRLEQQEFKDECEKINGKIKALDIIAKDAPEKIAPHIEAIKPLKKVKIVNVVNLLKHHWPKILIGGLLGLVGGVIFAFTFPVSGALAIAGVIVGGAILGGALGGGAGAIHEAWEKPPVIKPLTPVAPPLVKRKEITDPSMERALDSSSSFNISDADKISTSLNLSSKPSSLSGSQHRLQYAASKDALVRGVSTAGIENWGDFHAAFNK